MKDRSLVLILTFLLYACSGSPDIGEQIEAQVSSGASQIDLTSVGPADWERVCVLGPYANNEAIEHILGFQWDSEAHTSIGGSDAITVLVFIQGNEVVAYEEYMRSKGDFAHLNPGCFPRADAVFVRKNADSGWVTFLARDQT